MGGAYCLSENMMRIMNMFCALIVRFEIGILQRKHTKHTNEKWEKKKKAHTQWEYEPKTIYQKSLTDG